MEKVIILGAASVGMLTARELAAAFADPGVKGVCLHNPEPSYGCSDMAAPPVKCSEHVAGYRHALEGTYYPTADELAWLEKQERQAEWEEIVRRGPPEYKVWDAEAKAAAWRAQQPRHQSQFTKSQSTTKARKAARRRAKAGRKATR